MRLFGKTPGVIRNQTAYRGANMDQGPHVFFFTALYGGAAMGFVYMLKQCWYHRWGWERGSAPTRQQMADRTLFDRVARDEPIANKYGQNSNLV